jgi:hypothetical protein
LIKEKDTKMKRSAVNSSDIPVINASHRDFILASGALFLSKSRKLIWYFETLVLSARFMQLLKTSPWGTRSKLLVNRYRLWDQELLPKVNSGAVVFEFGVASGIATKWWASKNLQFAEWHGFDTFTGLPSPWIRGGVEVMEAGVFDQTHAKSELPEVKASYPLKWHKGLISESLLNADFTIPSDRQLIIFVDVDLYEPTKDVLLYFSKHLKSGDLIYFDEGFDPWNEGLALKETIEVIPRFEAIAHTGSALLLEIG